MLADCLTLYLPDQIFNTLYCQPYNSYNVSSENVVLNQLIIPCQITASILHQRLLLANSLQDVSAQKKNPCFSAGQNIPHYQAIFYHSLPEYVI